MKPGDRRHHYTLLRRLGRGGVGEVWLALNEKLQSEVAIKVPRDARHAPRMIQEGRAISMLAHENVVRAFDMYNDETPMIVMEYLRGETLGSYLDREMRMSVPVALSVLRPILDALNCAHRVGIVHRDVTPENIFLALTDAGDVVPKLIDWGLAKVPHGEQMTGENWVGTLGYMAPEQGGGGVVDGRTDVFGVAAVLFSAIVGFPPFPLQPHGTQLEPPAYDPLIGEPVWRELRRALSAEPRLRHKTASDFATALMVASGEKDFPIQIQVMEQKESAPLLQVAVVSDPELLKAATGPATEISPAPALSEDAVRPATEIAWPAVAMFVAMLVGGAFVFLKGAWLGQASAATYAGRSVTAFSDAPTNSVAIGAPSRPAKQESPPKPTGAPVTSKQRQRRKAVATTPGF